MEKPDLPKRRGKREKKLARRPVIQPSGHSEEQRMIQRIFSSTNQKLDSLLNRTMIEPERMSKGQQRIISEIAQGKNPYPAELLFHEVFFKMPEEQRRRIGIRDPLSLPKIYSSLFAGAVLEFGKRDFYKALRFLHDVYFDWLTMPIQKNPGETGRRAFVLEKAISSAWVSAHAAEFARLDIKRTRFKEPGDYGRALWSTDAVEELAECGDLNDLIALRIIGSRCQEGAMEGDCSKAIGRIITRTAILTALASGGKELSQQGIRTRLNRLQLANRFETLFELTHLASAIRALPNLRRLGGYYSPVSAVTQGLELGKLARERLSGEISFKTQTYLIGGLGWKELDACKGFLLEQGMAVPSGKEGHVLLTEKGTGIITLLCRSIGEIEIRKKTV